MKTKITFSKDTKNQIDHKIFGNFIEHLENCILGGICDPENPLSDEKGIRKDVLELCKDLSPSILRFPGGTVVGIYHWQDHVGPLNERKKMKNIIWGDRLCHEFGTAEFVEYCRKIGAEPMICVNMPTGSAEEAAHWVEYCNGTDDTYYANLRRSHGYEEPFNVKYWCIGNESNAEPDLGWQHDVNVYIREAWEFVKYMKLTDPTIKLVFVSHDEEWNRAVLDSLSSVCDYMSVHCYARKPDYGFIGRFVERNLAPVEALIDEYNKKEIEFSHWYRFPHRAEPIKIALDEWNIWSHNFSETDRYGLMDRYDWKSALWVAKFLNMMLRHSDHIGIANMAQMVNVIAPICADKDGSFRQTIFYPMREYRKHCGTALLDVCCDCENVDAVGTLHENGQITLFAVNTSGDAATAELELKATAHKVILCDSENLINDMQNDYVKVFDAPADSDTVILPPYSISVIRL